MLDRSTMRGPWAGLPVSWTLRNEFDKSTYQSDVVKCCRAGIPGIYTGGTTGEFYAMEFAEYKEVASATVNAAADFPTPVMIGVTSTYTLGAQRRAAFAAEISADAIQVALPYWMPVDEKQIISFFSEVSEACDHLPLSIYETTRSKVTLTVEQHHQIQSELPNYVMVKANAGTVGYTSEGCSQLSNIVNVFVGEGSWRSLVPHGAAGGCSSVVYWNPRVCLRYWDTINHAPESEECEDLSRKFERLFEFLDDEFAPRGFTDSAYDRLGAIVSGFLNTTQNNRAPYVAPSEEDCQIWRDWYAEYFPEMLEL